MQNRRRARRMLTTSNETRLLNINIESTNNYRIETIIESTKSMMMMMMMITFGVEFDVLARRVNFDAVFNRSLSSFTCSCYEKLLEKKLNFSCLSSFLRLLHRL